MGFRSGVLVWFRIWGLRFRVGLGFGVWGHDLGFRIGVLDWGLGFGVWGHDLGFRIGVLDWGFGLGFVVLVWGFGLGFRV